MTLFRPKYPPRGYAWLSDMGADPYLVRWAWGNGFKTIRQCLRNCPEHRKDWKEWLGKNKPQSRLGDIIRRALDNG